MVEMAERGSIRTWNCFICGKEGHFPIAYPEKNNLMALATELGVNLISSEALVYAITRSKAADERLNIREEYKEAGRARDKSKKVSGVQRAEESRLVAGITENFFPNFLERLACSTTREVIRVKATIPDRVMESGMRKLKGGVPAFSRVALSPSKSKGADSKSKGVVNHKDT